LIHINNSILLLSTRFPGQLIKLKAHGWMPAYSNMVVVAGSQEGAMNSSLCTADGTTHLKIVATALVAAIVVVWIGIAARGTENSGQTRTPLSPTVIAGPSLVATNS
jgi:hypothetical protein